MDFGIIDNDWIQQLIDEIGIDTDEERRRSAVYQWDSLSDKDKQ